MDGELPAAFDPLSVQHPAPIGEVYPDWSSDVVFTDDRLHAVSWRLSSNRPAWR